MRNNTEYVQRQLFDLIEDNYHNDLKIVCVTPRASHISLRYLLLLFRTITATNILTHNTNLVRTYMYKSAMFCETLEEENEVCSYARLKLR